MVLATRVYSLQGERVFEIEEEGGPEGGCNIPGVAQQNRAEPGTGALTPSLVTYVCRLPGATVGEEKHPKDKNGRHKPLF